MISKNLAKALEENGFVFNSSEINPDKNHVYCIYGGYFVTVYESAGKKVAYFNFKFPENEENSLKRYDMSESFASDMEEYAITDYTIDEDGMRVTSGGNVPTFLKLIDRCINLLMDNEIRGVGYCSSCGNKFGSRNPKKVTIGFENKLMCEHCALDTVEEINNRNNETTPSNTNGVSWKGVLGSIAMSLVGVVLYFILYYWLSPAVSQSGIAEIRYIFCASGFLTSLLAYNGYRLFCKKVSLSAYISVPVISFVSTAIGQYLGVVFEFIAKNGFGFSALSNKAFWLVHLRNTIPEDLAKSFVDYSAIFYKLLAISLMFAAVGSAIFLLSMHDKLNKNKETVEIVTINVE